MTDIRIVNHTSLAGVLADWLLLPSGGLDEAEELANVFKLQLLTDRLALPDDVLPDPDSTDRRGWWGDLDAEVIWDGWPLGCRNWLLMRAKITPAEAQEGATLVRAEMYTRECLQPLITKRVVSRIDVSAERVGLERIDVLVTAYRGPRVAVALRFQGLWDEVAAA
jgi:phage gp46-like protein